MKNNGALSPIDVLYYANDFVLYYICGFILMHYRYVRGRNDFATLNAIYHA